MIAFHTLPGVCVECAAPLADNRFARCDDCHEDDVIERTSDTFNVFWWLALIPIMTLAWIVVLIWMLLF